VNAHLILAVLAVLALRVGWLYWRPFGPCPKCKGTGHIKRGARRRPVCPRCKGCRRVQRRGSRTVHRLARRIRDGRQAAARYQQQEEESQHGRS
jgi:DnaJ-class molecular chaperone